MAAKYLELADFLLIAEAVTGVPAEALARSDRTVHLAESALAAPAAAYGGREFYRDVATKAAVLCARLVRNHPLLDGNKRVAFLCMIEFLERNGRKFSIRGKRAQDVFAEAVISLADGVMSETDFASLVRARLR